MKFKTIVILAIIILFVIVLLQNTQVTDFKIFFWKFSMSRIILYPLILIIGIIIGFVGAKFLGKKKKREIEETQ